MSPDEVAVAKADSETVALDVGARSGAPAGNSGIGIGTVGTGSGFATGAGMTTCAGVGVGSGVLIEGGVVVGEAGRKLLSET